MTKSNCTNSLTQVVICSNRLLQLLFMMTVAACMLLGMKLYGILVGPIDPTIKSYIVTPLLTFLFVGLFFVKHYIVRRTKAIGETVELIMRTGDLSQRIPTNPRWEGSSNLSTLLNQMLAEIEQLMGGVRTVADNIAHDLRTPLTRLRNHIEEMRAGVTACPTIEEQQQRYSELIAECDSLLATFQALLRISNIESGRRHAAFSHINLADLLDDVIELYEPLAAEKLITLNLNIDSDVPFEGDKDILFQAFTNLIDNAIKYTPNGGVISIALRTPTDKTPLTFELRDSGIGIADEHKANVFRRFYRVDPSRCKSAGSGLGLSLVAAIIALHKGTITLTDNQPSGLVVTVTL